MPKYHLCKTKECHNCGWSHIQDSSVWTGRPNRKDPDILREKCPVCREVLYNGDKMEDYMGCAVDLQNKVYNQYIKGNDEKEKLYQIMLEYKKQIASERHAEAMRIIYKDKPKDNPSQPKCPICNSTNLTKLNVINRSVSFGVWGFGSNKIGKTYQCNNCKATF